VYKLKSVIKTNFTIQFVYNLQAADSVSCLFNKRLQLRLIITYQLHYQAVHVLRGRISELQRNDDVRSPPTTEQIMSCMECSTGRHNERFLSGFIQAYAQYTFV